MKPNGTGNCPWGGKLDRDKDGVPCESLTVRWRLPEPVPPRYGHSSKCRPDCHAHRLAKLEPGASILLRLDLGPHKPLDPGRRREPERRGPATGRQAAAISYAGALGVILISWLPPMAEIGSSPCENATRQVRRKTLFSGTAVVTYSNSKRVPNLRQFGKNILGDPFVAEFSHGLDPQLPSH